MDYKKLYLEYKQKYLMSQKYLMGGAAKTTENESISAAVEFLQNSPALLQLLVQLNHEPYTVFDNESTMQNINGKSMGKKPNMLQRTYTKPEPVDAFHSKSLQLKYTFINRTTLEDYGKCDESFENLIDDASTVHEKKLFTISYNP